MNLNMGRRVGGAGQLSDRRLRERQDGEDVQSRRLVQAKRVERRGVDGERRGTQGLIDGWSFYGRTCTSTEGR
jgi:hypothetical protein